VCWWLLGVSGRRKLGIFWLLDFLLLIFNRSTGFTQLFFGIGLDRPDIDKKEVVSRDLYPVDLFDLLRVKEDIFIKCYVSGGNDLLF
jgi:hypothetical protein